MFKMPSLTKKFGEQSSDLKIIHIPILLFRFICEANHLVTFQTFTHNLLIVTFSKNLDWGSKQTDESGWQQHF